MSIESCARDVQRHQTELARLQKDKAQAVAKAAEENKRANQAVESASRTSSTSMVQSKLRDAQRYQEASARHQRRVAELEAQIASEQGRLLDAERRLRYAQEQDARKRAQELERSSREHERRMRTISGKLLSHDRMHEAALCAIERLQRLPERITVLFFASNPLDQQQLRLDEEVRAIGEMIRKAEHRDAVQLESRWAVRPLDVLQAINECRPRIIHFSGHGSEKDEIVFQDNEGSAKFVSKEAVVQTMAAASGDIQLVFFNTCFSRGQAEAVVQHIAAAVGMNDSIGDEAARVFAASFYSAIGFGLSVGVAFKQARAALLLEGIGEDMTPELFTMDGVAPDGLVLVRPAETH